MKYTMLTITIWSITMLITRALISGWTNKNEGTKFLSMLFFHSPIGIKNKIVIVEIPLKKKSDSGDVVDYLGSKYNFIPMHGLENRTPPDY